MEAGLYRALALLLLQVPHPRRRRVCFSDHLIVLVQLWAVLHDRPVTWACQAENWPRDRTHELPSEATMSRRLRTCGVQQLLQRMLSKLSNLFPDTLVKQIDSKALLVGHYSSDRDATRGRAAGGKMARGYKLAALSNGSPIKHWTLAGLNVNDQVLAAQLLPRLAEDQGCFGDSGGYVAADNGFDANKVHEVAAAVNHQLVAPPRKSNRGVRDTRRNRPQRIRSLDLCDNPLRPCGVRRWFGGDLLRARVAAERNFSQLVFDGMHAPPPWVRRPHRVATWVACKLIIRLFKLHKKAGVAA